MRKKSYLLVLSVTMVAASALLWQSFSVQEDHGVPDELADFTQEQRPQADRFLFDYATVLRHHEEGVHLYLERLSSRFQIEGLIVTLPALPSGHTLETLAVDLFNNWRIGMGYEGRGLLLLLVDDAKQVKLEVGYALEDVFTDSFSGYVEDLQLGSYYRGGDVGTGLVAAMEMFEERAQIKKQGEYTPELIARADAELLTGGAGAKRDLSQYEEVAAPLRAPVPKGHGARSPEEAWEIMLTKWAGEGVDIDVDVYTEMTRIAMGDANKPDPRTLKWLDHWRDADYQVLREGDHAVIWFGAIDGWQNSPFLFCNTGDGWKFDIVWQRRLVVMAENPKWQVMQGPFPYVALMSKAWQSTAKDLPLSGKDLYRCTDDAAIAGRIDELRNAIADAPEDAAAGIELMRLHVITDQRPNLVRPLIKRAKQLSPQSPEPFLYAAIYNVNSVFQYRTALKDTERYINLRPNAPLGYKMKGFMLYRLGKYTESIDALERAVELDPQDGYAYALMARDYTMLARKAQGLDKEHYGHKARAMRHKAQQVRVPDNRRLAWLDGWLEKRL